MYTAEFENIPNTDKFQYVNIFTLTNAIYTQAMYFTNNYADYTSQARNYALDFLFGNVMNDIWIRTIESSEILSNAMQKEVTNTINFNKGMFIASLSTLGVLILAILFVLPSSYFETIDFMENIINAGNSKEIYKALDDLKFLKDFLEKKLNSRDQFVKEKVKAKAIPRMNERKKGRREGLASKTIIYISIIIVLQVLPIFLVYKNFSIFDDATSRIMPVIKDINNLNNIIYTSMPVQAFLGLIFSRPYTVVLNQPLLNVLDSSLVAYKDSVSFTRNFLPETLEFLQQPYCQYYQVNEIYADCDVLFRNMGLKGITSTIIAAQEYQVGFKNLALSLPPTPQNIYFLVFQYENIEITYLIGFGASLAITDYQKTLVASLLDRLNQASKDILLILVPALLGGLFIIGVVGWIIFKVIWKDRKWNSGTLNILPLQVMMTNKGLRLYMLNESKKFHKVVKKFENIKNKQSSSISI